MKNFLKRAGIIVGVSVAFVCAFSASTPAAATESRGTSNVSDADEHVRCGNGHCEEGHVCCYNPHDGYHCEHHHCH